MKKDPNVIKLAQLLPGTPKRERNGTAVQHLVIRDAKNKDVCTIWFFFNENKGEWEPCEVVYKGHASQKMDFRLFTEATARVAIKNMGRK